MGKKKKQGSGSYFHEFNNVPSINDNILIEELGRGGMGVVWLVYNKQYDCLRALKLFGGRTSSGNSHILRFEDEKRITKQLGEIVNSSFPRLHEDGIVELTEQGVEYPYFISDYVPGMPLQKLISRITPEKVIQVCYGIAQRLHEICRTCIK